MARSTHIQYYLPSEDNVNLTIYDTTGKEISVLINERKQAGNHSVQFHSDLIASGLYLYRIKAGNYEQTRKMLILK